VNKQRSYPWCRDLLEKLTGLQLVKKFPAFHGTRRFITALTSKEAIKLRKFFNMENDTDRQKHKLERRYSEHTDKKLKWERMWPESKLKTTKYYELYTFT